MAIGGRIGVPNVQAYPRYQDAEPSIFDADTAGAVNDGVTDNYWILQRLINVVPVGSTIRFGNSRTDIYLVSQPLYLKGSCNYIINGEIKIQNGNTDLLTEDTNIGDHTIKVTTPSKFAVGQYISVTDDNITFEIEGVETVRDARYAWGGRITSISGNIITLDSANAYNIKVSENAVCGHSQGCIIIDDQDNIAITGSGLLNGNRYNQIAVIPSADVESWGYWENLKCGCSLSVWSSHNTSISGIAIEDGLLHSLAIGAPRLGGDKICEDIILDGIQANTGHDKNIMFRELNRATITDVTCEGNNETWEDGLMFYLYCLNVTVTNFLAQNCRRTGFGWNRFNQYLTASNITTINCGTRTGYGCELNGHDVVVTELHIYDNLRVGVWESDNIVINDVTIDSPSGDYDYLLGINNTVENLEINNLVIQNSEAAIDLIVIVTGAVGVVFNNGGIYDCLGNQITIESYSNAVWNNFEGLINPFEPELIQFLAALSTDVGGPQKIKLNDIVTKLKTRLSITNLTDWFDDLLVLSSNTQESSLKNLVKSAHTAAIDGNPVFTAFEGFTGTGAVGEKIRTNFIPSSDGVNYKTEDAFIGVYFRSGGTLNGYAVRASSNLYVHVGNASTFNRAWINSADFDSIALTWALGFKALHRTIGNLYGHYINGNGGQSYEPAAAPSGEITLLNEDDCQLSFFVVGKFSDLTSLNIIRDVFEEYMDSNGKGVIT